MNKDKALDEIIFALRTIQDERCTTKAEIDYIQEVIDFTFKFFEENEREEISNRI